MKFKFNMQSALVSCFVAVLSVAINQDANAFVAAPFVRDSSSSSSEPPYQTASSSIEETSDSSQIFMKPVLVRIHRLQRLVARSKRRQMKARLFL